MAAAPVLVFKRLKPAEQRESAFIRKARLIEQCRPRATEMLERLLDDLLREAEEGA